jgi:hypothetical protein
MTETPDPRFTVGMIAEWHGQRYRLIEALRIAAMFSQALASTITRISRAAQAHDDNQARGART